MLASIVTRPSCPRRVGEARVVDAQGGEPSEGGRPGRARADDERADREEQAACGEFSRQQRQVATPRSSTCLFETVPHPQHAVAATSRRGMAI
jgi:hypothetical protein